MAKNTNPQTAGERHGPLSALRDLGWPIFIIDEFLEHAGKLLDHDWQKGPVDEIIIAILVIVMIGLVLVSPFTLSFVASAWLAWVLGFGLLGALKAGGIGMFLAAIALMGWVVKKVNRDPWTRALMQAKLEYQSDPKAKPGDLVKRVRDALGQDSRAAVKADDAVRSVLGGGRKFRLRIGRRHEEGAVARRRGRSSFHFDRSLRKRLPRRILSDLLPKRKSRRDDGWDFL